MPRRGQQKDNQVAQRQSGGSPVVALLFLAAGLSTVATILWMSSTTVAVMGPNGVVEYVPRYPAMAWGWGGPSTTVIMDHDTTVINNTNVNNTMSSSSESVEAAAPPPANANNSGAASDMGGDDSGQSGGVKAKPSLQAKLGVVRHRGVSYKYQFVTGDKGNQYAWVSYPQGARSRSS